MNQAIYKGNTIEYYDSLDDTPIDRFVAHNFGLSLDAGIGSDMAAVDAKIDPLLLMLDKKDYENARNELINLKQRLNFIVQKQHPKLFSFAAMVHKVNGKEFNDLTENGLQRLVERMGKIGLSWGTVKYLIDKIKKKSKRKQLFTFRT